MTLYVSAISSCFSLCYILLFHALSVEAGNCYSASGSSVARNTRTYSGTSPLPNAETPRRNSRNVRALGGQIFPWIPICGTSLFAHVHLKQQIPIFRTPQGTAVAQLAFRVAHFAMIMRDHQLLPRVDVWPTVNNPLKFEMKQATVQAPQLEKTFLRWFAQFLLNDVSLGGPTLDYDFNGQVTSRHGTVIYVFRCYAVPTKQVQSEKIMGINFGQRDLHAIFAVRDQIVDRTRPEDIILFIGNTAAYFYYAFANERNVFQVITSGYPLGKPPISINKEGYFTSEGITNFKLTMLANPFSQLTPTSRIIFVDHARTGTSIAELALLLRSSEHFNLVPPSTKIYFINLIYPETPPGQKDLSPPMELGGIEFLPDLPNVVVETLARYDYGYVGRIVPSYPAYYWEVNWRQVPNPDEEVAKTILEKIRIRKEDLQRAQGKQKQD